MVVITAFNTVFKVDRHRRLYSHKSLWMVRMTAAPNAFAFAFIRRRESSARSAEAPHSHCDDIESFDRLVAAYFAPPAPSQSSPSKKRRRGASHADADANAAERSPEAALKALKRRLRGASSEGQVQLTQRVFAAIERHAQRAQANAKANATDALFSRVVSISAELFERSVAFRALVAARAAAFFELLLAGAGGFLLQPRTKASGAQRTHLTTAQQAQNARLQQVLALVAAWARAFGDRYPALAAGRAALEQRGFAFASASCAQRGRGGGSGGGDRVAGAGTAASSSVVQVSRHGKQEQRQEEEEEEEEEDEQERETRRRLRVRRVLTAQVERATPEIVDAVGEMERAFELLVPSLDAFSGVFGGGGDSGDGAGVRRAVASGGASDVADKADSEDEDEDEEDGVDADDEEELGDGDDADRDGDDDAALSRLDMNQIVQAYGLGSAAYELTIEIPTAAGICEQSSDNEVLFRHLSDGVLRIRKRFLPLVADWRRQLEVVTSARDPDGVDSVGAANGVTRERDDEHNDDDDSRVLARRLDALQRRLELTVSKWGDLVAESETRRLAAVAPSIVSLPLTASDLREPPPPRRNPLRQQDADASKRRRVVLSDSRGSQRRAR
ncbi:hypothetical protein PybrP1_011752 [[Pythium] brassicae (nom. inval.)]|nr:hypothetical protein PybrP1_011752 [[Pythium] brassicae (nom. inval.)]